MKQRSELQFPVEKTAPAPLPAKRRDRRADPMTSTRHGSRVSVAQRDAWARLWRVLLQPESQPVNSEGSERAA